MKTLKDWLLGEHVTTFAVLQRKERKQKKNGEPFLAMEVSDVSARVTAVMWENVDSAVAEVGQIIKVAGTLEEYQGQRQLKIDKIRAAREDDQVDLATLIPATPKDRGMLWQQYQNFINSLAQPHLLSLLRRIFAEEDFVKAFCDTPGGKKWHHAYLGGLLEHTVNIATICDRLAKIYPQVDRDVLMAAALLHDIGKVDSYTRGPSFEYTDAGRLLGHIVIGAQLVAEKIRQFPEFPATLALRLQHLILSHQGTLENASPVVPMTPEGFLLYYADEIDSKMNAILRISEKEGGEGKRWSEYVNLLGRYLYLGS